jgi:hypothetical protein
VGFEPTASATRTQRSTKLSHSPWRNTHHAVLPGRIKRIRPFMGEPLLKARKLPHHEHMTVRRKQLLLFLLCALVLTSGGYGWGYATTFTEFYSLSAVMDRETLDLEFNSRLLHYMNSNQSALLRARLSQRLTEQIRYIDRILDTSAHKQLTNSAAASLSRARAVLSEPHDLGKLAANAKPPAPPIH